MQRQYNVGLNSVTKSISQVVDKNRYAALTHRGGPERAWNSGALSAQDLNRRNGDDYNIYNNRHKKPQKHKPPIPTYASNVSHLVV
jgi:hypothetical protein